MRQSEEDFINNLEKEEMTLDTFNEINENLRDYHFTSKEYDILLEYIRKYMISNNIKIT